MNWELFKIKSETIPVKFEQDKLKSIDSNYNTGLGMRVIEKGKIGFSSTNKIDDIDNLRRNALSAAQFGETAKFIFPSKNDSSTVQIFDKKIENYSTEQAVKLGERIIEELKSSDEDIKINLTIEKNIIEYSLENSNGLNINFKKTIFDLGIEIIKIDEHGILFIYDGFGYCRLYDNDNDLSPRLENIKYLLLNTKKVVPISTGKYNIIFTPKAIAGLFSILLKSFNGKLVQKGVSYLKDKLNNEIFDKKLTILDKPTEDYYSLSFPTDTEGVKTEELILIDKGRVNQFIYDLQTAGISGQKSTGSGYRSYSAQPCPSLTNIFVKPGNICSKEIIKAMDNGILVDEFIGLGQSNILAGEFSANIALGYKIEKGEIVGRIKDCMTAGNVFEMFKNICEISSDCQDSGSSSLPYFLFSNLSVAAP